MNLISLSSLISLFSPEVCRLGESARIGGMSQSQPTRCGHALTRCPLPGLARACRPSNLARDKRQKGG